MKVEYRVRPVVRYVVTRFYTGENQGGCEGIGEFPNEQRAYDVANKMQEAENWEIERIGHGPGMELARKVV